MVGLALAALLSPAWAVGPAVSTGPFSVTATSGAVQVTLTLHSRQIHAGDFPWYKVAVKNVGGKGLFVSDFFFDDPWKIEDSYLTTRRGLYLEVIGPAGKSVRPWTHRMMLDPRLRNKPPPPPDPARDAEQRRLAALWKKQGLSRDEINRRLYDWAIEHQDLPPMPSGHMLKPGESLSTTPWRYLDSERQRGGWTPPAGTEDLRELVLWEFDKPGEYRIRFVYDLDIQRTLREHWEGHERRLKKFPEVERRELANLQKAAAHPESYEVAVATEWIAITVSP